MFLAFIFSSIILQVNGIVLMTPQNNGTIVQPLSVNGTETIYSYGYPNQIVTSNVDLDYNPLNLDWNLTSSNGMDFVILFDRVDLDTNDGDKLILCDEESYPHCAKSPLSLECRGIQVNDTVTKIEWKSGKGPLFVVFHPVVPRYTGGELVYVRSGYRATVLESDPMTRKFFECNRTYDIHNNFDPLYFVSQGFPRQTTSFLPCTVTIVSDGGIRIRVPIFNVNEADSLTIDGGGTMGKHVVNGFNDPNDFIDTLYYYQNVTITAKFQQSTEELANYFVIYAESYDVTSSICDAEETDYYDTSFPIQTSAYDRHENYITNLNCTYTVSRMALNSQLMLQIFDFDMENGADWLKWDDVQFSGKLSNQIIVAPVNLSSTSLTITADGLDSRRGVNAYMHKMDCNCNSGTIPLQKQVTTTISMPESSFEGTGTYCKGIQCKWDFVAPPGLLTQLMFTQLDVSYDDYPEIYVDGKYFAVVKKAGTWGVFNQTNITVTWSSLEEPYDYFAKGFQLTVEADTMDTSVVDLCNTSIVRETGNEKNVLQLQFQSCKGVLALQVFDANTVDLLQVFDGDFLNGTLMNLRSDFPNVASGRLLSVRINHNNDGEDSPYDFVVSDSFTDQQGKVCGGITTGGLSTDPGCVHVLFDEIAYLKQSGAPLPIYKGVSLDKKDLLPMSNATTPFEVITGTQFNTFTFQIPVGFTGGNFEFGPTSDEVDLEDSTQVLLVSPDYLNKKCEECNLATMVLYRGNANKWINIQLLETLGDANIEVDETWFNGTNGLINITSPNPTIDYYTPAATGSGHLVARLTATDSPLSTTVRSTTTTSTTTTSMSMTSAPTTSQLVNTSTMSWMPTTSTGNTSMSMLSSSESSPSTTMSTTSIVTSTVTPAATTMTKATTKAPSAITTTTPVPSPTTIPDSDKSSTECNYLLSFVFSCFVLLSLQYS